VAKDKEQTPAAPKDRLAALFKDDLVGAVMKTHGNRLLQRASESDLKDNLHIPTNFFPLDYCLGGGFPIGRISTVWGDKGSFKTTVLLKTVANAQKMCRKCGKFFSDYAILPETACTCKAKTKEDRDELETLCAFIDVEASLDLKWASRLGVNVDRLALSQPESAEAALDVLEMLIRTGKCDVIVMDSIAFLTPQKEIDESVAKVTVGQQANLITKGVRKITAALNAAATERDRKPTLLFTNQMRMQIGVMFGNPETQPGGKAAGHSASVEVKMRPGKYKMDDLLGRPLHAEVKFRVEKNKTAANKMEGEFLFVLTDTETKKVGEALDEPIYMDLAEKLGLLEHKAGWTIMGESFPKKENVEERLEKDPVFKAHLRDQLFAILVP
jgi:recombination protein RecA